PTFLQPHVHRRALHSFPTRRSSDLGLIDLSRNGRYADDVRIEILGSDGAIFVETHPAQRVRLGRRAGLETVWERAGEDAFRAGVDRKSTRLNSSHLGISYAVFCLKK